MFDKTRLALALAYVSLPNLAMLALANLSGVTLFAWFCESFVGFGSLYILFIFAESELDDRRRLNASDNPRERTQVEEKRILLDMNTGKPMYAFQTPAVKIDARKHFAITLIRMLDYNGHDASKLDLTEGYWLKGKPRKWKGKNEDFRIMMHDWDGTVFEKSDPLRPNSRYVLRSETELKRKADGR